MWSWAYRTPRMTAATSRNKSLRECDHHCLTLSNGASRASGYHFSLHRTWTRSTVRRREGRGIREEPQGACWECRDVVQSRRLWIGDISMPRTPPPCRAWRIARSISSLTPSGPRFVALRPLAAADAGEHGPGHGGPRWAGSRPANPEDPDPMSALTAIAANADLRGESGHERGRRPALSASFTASARLVAPSFL